MQGKRVLVVVPNLASIKGIVYKMTQEWDGMYWEYHITSKKLRTGQDEYLFLPYNKNTAKRFVDDLMGCVFTDLILEVELPEEVERQIRIHVR